MFNLTEVDAKVIEYMLTKEKVHYKDLIELTGLSRMTVVKELDHLTALLAPYGIDLVRKKGDGLYLTGDISKLLRIRSNGTSSQVDRAKELQLMLLFSEVPITIDTLAERLFLSRTAIRGDLKAVRQAVTAQGLVLKTTAQGLLIVGSESAKRHAISEVLNACWSEFQTDFENSAAIFDSRWDRIFSQSYLNEILQITKDFLKVRRIDYTDYQIKDLVIHIAIMIQRVQHEHCLQAPVEPLQQLIETQDLVEQINRHFRIMLPNSERAYLNLHILALRDQSSGFQKNQALTDMKHFLRQHLVKHDSDETLIEDLALHLVATIGRLKKGLYVRNPYTLEIKKNFPLSFERAVQLATLLNRQFNLEISEDELAYVALHFQSFIERKSASNLVDTIIVCSTGIGMSRFLEQRVREVYHDKINVLSVQSLAEFERDTVQAPLVLSTIDIASYTGNVVVVNPMLEDFDREKINIALEKLASETKTTNPFIDLLDPQRIYLPTQNDLTAEQVIQMVGQHLVANEYALAGVSESAIAREDLSSTVMKEIATPHAQVDYILEPSISIVLAKNGIDWRGKKVYLVFFIGLNNSVHPEIRQIYKYFTKLIDPVFVKRALKCDNSRAVYQLIRQFLNEQHDITDSKEGAK